MGVLQRFERRLGGMVEGLFARAFKSEVQPVEIAAALQREVDAKAAVVARDRTLVPNVFVVDLGDHDYERLAPYERPLTAELAAMVREHADDQRYSFVGPVSVELNLQADLETGVFHVRSEALAGRESPSSRDTPPGPLARPSSPSFDPDEPVHRRAAQPEPQPIGVRPETTASLAASARSATYGRLVVHEGKRASYDVELRQPVTVIGRGTSADVRLGDQAVSRRHAEVRVAGAATTVSDLESTNGTFLNGSRITTAALVDGDEVRVGETVLIFQAAQG